MTVVYDTTGAAVEIAPGRGDLRKSSQPYSIRRDTGQLNLIGRHSVSYAQLFAKQPWVAAAVMRMLTWAVRVPLKVYRREDNGDTRKQLEPEEHPLARIVKRPWLGYENGAASPARLVQCLLGPVLVHGNTVVQVETKGGEEYLKPLDWRCMVPLGTTSGEELVGWRYEREGETKYEIPLDRALHLAWWSPLGPLGVSPLEQLGVTISIEDAAQRYQQSLFGRGARPPSAIETSTEFIQLERGERQALIDGLREDVDELYAGPDAAGRPAILPPGLQWKGIGHTAVEAELIDQRKVAREEVAAVYQIPPPMMGILDNATYSNIETQKEMSYTDCLGPPMVLIEQTMTAMLARDLYNEDDVYLEFDFGPVLRGDRMKEITAFRNGIMSGIYTPNEARRGLNLRPDEHEDADKLWMPVNNLAPLGEEPEEEAEEPAEEEEQPQQEAAEARPLADDLFGEFEEHEHPRDNQGRFRKKDVAPGDASGLPELPWVDPPPPLGKGGERKPGGYSADRAFGTNTKLGRIGEKAFIELLGGEILHPEGQGEQSPLDVRVGDYGVEVKGVARRSTSYKASPKKHEIEEKEEAAKEMGVRPALSIVVMDADAKEAYVYWRDGLATGRLSKNTGWKFAGKTELPDNASVAQVFELLLESSVAEDRIENRE